MNTQIKNKIIQISIAFVALIIFNDASLHAQTSRPLSLQEAINLGLANSKKLKGAHTEVEQAQARVNQMKMNQLPDIKISGAYMRMTQPNINLDIPLGGGSDSAGGGKGMPDIKVNEVMYGMANASLPLFTGLRIHNGIESAKLLQKATELDVEKDKDEVIQNIVASYYNLYKANAAVALVNENLRQAQSRVTDLSNLEKNGLLARNDLLKAELQQSNVELTLADAQNNRNISQFNMNLLLGIDEKTTLILDTAVSENLSELKSLEEWQQLALEHRSDYQALDYRQQAAGKNIKAIKGEYFPSVALTGGYIAGKIPNVVTITNAVNVGLGLSYNIASLYKTGPKIKEAQAQQQQLYWSSQEMNDGIRTAIYQAYENYKEAVQKISVYKKAVDQANENYRITKNKYDNALETTTNLLDADVAQLQAKINYEYSKVDAVVAYNKLYETAGIITQLNQSK